MLWETPQLDVVTRIMLKEGARQRERVQSEQSGSDGSEGGDCAEVEADDMEGLYRSSQVKVWSEVQGSPKDLTAFKDVKRPFLAGKLAQVHK